jgi:8-amino-7-oxononanoate synthase
MRKDPFDRFDPILKAHAALPKELDDPFAVRMDQVLSQTEAVIDGRKTILCGTNNYMGMTFNPEAMAKAKEAIETFGTGTTGSRVLNGTYIGHRRLEDALKDFYGTKYAMVFSTGYLANLGVISTLPGPDDFIVIDADCHASIYDGCAMGRASIVRFRHNDPADLDKRLGRLPKEAGALVVVEGVYSMLGDEAPLKELVAVTKKHGAMIVVDEAHSMGFCGKTGRGVAQAQGAEKDVDFIIGTFSKSVGTVGGFCVANHPKFEVLRLVARPYMFTASLPPSVVASAASAIATLKTADDLRARLWANARQLHAGLKALGYKLGTAKAESPIVALCLVSTEDVVRFWSGLLRAGVYVNMAVPPATPQGLCLLRCSVCASHTPEQIETIIGTFQKVAKALNIPVGETADATAAAASA